MRRRSSAGSWPGSRCRRPWPTALLGFTDNPIVFLLVINVVLLLLGMILEPTSALLIVTPILLPVAVAFGIDPLQFGSIVIFNLMIGLLTPPMGGVCFVLSSVTRIPVTGSSEGRRSTCPRSSWCSRSSRTSLR